MTRIAEDEPRWLDGEQQAIWRTFLEMQNRLAGRLNRELLDRSGVSGADFAVLVQLSEHVDGRMRVLELARSLRWEKSRLSHQLSRMQHRGLIERSDCPEDRRGAFVRLTADGRATVESAAPQHVESVQRYVFDGIESKQLAAFGAVCRSVLTRLDVVPCPSGADVVPCPSGADVVPCPSGVDVVPCPSGADVVPCPSGADVVPCPLGDTQQDGMFDSADTGPAAAVYPE